jgi:hypothetical protein
MKRRALLIAAVLTAAFLCPPPAAADPVPTRAEQWRAIAAQALDAYGLALVPVQSAAFTRGSALWATGTLHGWSDPRVQPALAQLMAVRNAEGGWGLGYPYPAFDGSMNGAGTTYTVTLAGHVGPALLAAWRGGALTDPEPLTRITTLLMTTARYAPASGPSWCIHNINAGVADYLTQANDAGFGRSGLQKLVVDIVRFEITTYNPAWSNWSYQNTGNAEQDPDHGAYSAASLYFAAYPVGREAAFQLLAAPASSDDGRRAHMRLVALPGGPGSMSRTEPGVTLWCEMGDQWLLEAQAYVTGSAGDAKRLAQAAMFAALNAAACASPATSPTPTPSTTTASPVPTTVPPTSPPTSTEPTVPTTLPAE